MAGNSKSGRQRVHIAEKQRKGTEKKSREKKYQEATMTVVAMDVMPPAPDRLGDIGREHWEVRVRELHKSKALAACDLGLLEALCLEWEMYISHREAQMVFGSFYKKGGSKKNKDDEDGKKVEDSDVVYIPHPIHYNGNNHLKQYLQLCQEFGFSPASRARIGLAAQEKPGTKAGKLVKNLGKAV